MQRIGEGCTGIKRDGNAKRFGDFFLGGASRFCLARMGINATIAFRGNGNGLCDEFACFGIQMFGLCRAIG